MTISLEVLAGILTILGTLGAFTVYAVRQGVWKGKFQEKTERNEQEIESLEASVSKIHDRIGNTEARIMTRVDDVHSTLSLQFASFNGKLDTLIGELKGRGAINGKKP